MIRQAIVFHSSGGHHHFFNINSRIRTFFMNKVTMLVQHELDLKVEKEIEIDGIGMGVLSDGTP